MTELVASHVDLLGDISFAQAQLIRRWDRELARKWPPVVQMNLRDFIEIKDMPGADQLPNYAENIAMLHAFISDKQTCYIRRVQDEARNALLISALDYERAQRVVPRLTLKIDGRDAVEGQAEVIDENTGEIVVEAIEARAAVAPLPVTIEAVDENGQAIQVENPAYAEAVAARAAAQAVIDGAGQEVLDLVEQRSGGE